VALHSQEESLSDLGKRKTEKEVSDRRSQGEKMKKGLSYKWEKQRGRLATFVLRWGEGFSDYVCVRGGYCIDDVPRKKGGYEKVPKGILVDSLGRIRYIRVVDTPYAFVERRYEAHGDGRSRLFPCDQLDYDLDTEQGLRVKKQAARYMNKLMEYLSGRAELACKHQVHRRQLWPSGYFGGFALCEVCQEHAWSECRKCGRDYCEKHLKEHKKRCGVNGLS